MLFEYVLKRDVAFQKACGHFIIRPVAMPPDDSVRFALNVPILDIWSSERLKLTEIGQFERNSKCKLSSAGIECEIYMTWLKASNSTWSLAWQRFEDLPGLQSCK